MHLKTALFCVSCALHVTGASAGTSAEYPATCTAWARPGAPSLSGPCGVSLGIAGASGVGARYSVTLRGGELIEIDLAGGSCTMNGLQCTQRPARSRGNVFFVGEDGGAIEFSAPPPGSM